jgi:hypothetical protein
MSLLASSNLTGEISGPDFLVGYGLIGLATLLGVIVARWRLAAGAPGEATGELSGRPQCSRL